ncbi:MAG: DUF169 domain-containing protein [Desulfovibrio sp.]|jgi:uncharacterized protein (DUF169 family)|nr:DUF169 domain-containing protein [Desulfovibrio sp.]
MTNLEMNTFINEYLRVATFPVAVKLLKKALPVKVKTARRLYKHRLAVCQGISLVRRTGRTIGFEKKDHDCPVSHVLFGFIEEPDIYKEGFLVAPLYTKDLEAGKNTATKEARLPCGTFDNLILSPLHKADFEPDVLIIYGNPAQMVRLVQGALYLEGGTVTSSFMGRGACGSSIAFPYKNKQVNVVLPGGGERVFGMTCDDEMCFAIPKEKIVSVLEGVKATHDGGVARMPTPFFGVSADPVFPPSYKELEDHIGL